MLQKSFGKVIYNSRAITKYGVIYLYCMEMKNLQIFFKCYEI